VPAVSEPCPKVSNMYGNRHQRGESVSRNPNPWFSLGYLLGVALVILLIILLVVLILRLV
jgi:hypothetical protein